MAQDQWHCSLLWAHCQHLHRKLVLRFCSSWGLKRLDALLHFPPRGDTIKNSHGQKLQNQASLSRVAAGLLVEVESKSLRYTSTYCQSYRCTADS